MKIDKIKQIAQERIEEYERSNIARNYQASCEMMEIDPDNNPNYKTEELPSHFQDIVGNPIKITVTKPGHIMPAAQWFEHVCKRLSDDI